MDTYDKNNLSPIPIVQNVVVFVHQQLEPNHFPMRSHSEEEKKQNLSLLSLDRLTSNDLILYNN